MGSIVIGSGYRGMTFLKILSQMDEKVLAIVEKDENKHNFVKWQLNKAQCSVPPFMTDYREAFDKIPKTEADKVFIITPDFTHREIFEECIKRGYHIFLEKPIATKRNDIVDMINMSRDYPMDIQVGFVLRFTDFYSKIKEIVREGLLGEVVLIQMNERLAAQKSTTLKKDWHNKWEFTGGFLNEKCSHDIDIMLWLKEDQAKPLKIFSYGSTKFGNDPKDYPERCSECPRKECYCKEKEDPILDEYLKEHPQEAFKFKTLLENRDKCFYHTNSEVFDNQSALIEFSDGSHGSFSYIMVSGDPGRDIRIHGTKGYLEGNFNKCELKYLIYDTNEEKVLNFENIDKHGGGDQRIIKNFLDKSKNNVSEKDSLSDGAYASIVSFMGDYSLYTERMENIPPIHQKGVFIPFEEYMAKINKPINQYNH